MRAETPYAPHVRDSSTSKAAAASVRPTVKTYEGLVLDLITNSGPMTCDEVERWFGLSHQSTSARIRGLVLKGFLVDYGERRKTRSGRSATVWGVRIRCGDRLRPAMDDCQDCAHDKCEKP
jgi:hypothetical protein